MAEGLLTKFTSLLTGSDDYADTDYEDQYNSYEAYEPQVKRAPEQTILAHDPLFPQEKQRNERSEKIVNLTKSGKQEMVIINPVDMSASEVISSHLMGNRTVICNLEQIDDYTGQRILDFVSGSVYSLGGSVTAASEKIFVIMPRSVELVSERLREEYDDYRYDERESFAM